MKNVTYIFIKNIIIINLSFMHFYSKCDNFLIMLKKHKITLFCNFSIPFWHVKGVNSYDQIKLKLLSNSNEQNEGMRNQNFVSSKIKIP